MAPLTYTSIDVTPVRNVFEAMMAGSLGVHDSESCWFTEEIGTYMSCWESLHDPLAKRHKISITRGRSSGLSQERISLYRGRHDHKVVGFTTTYAITAYHH